MAGVPATAGAWPGGRGMLAAVEGRLKKLFCSSSGGGGSVGKPGTGSSV